MQRRKQHVVELFQRHFTCAKLNVLCPGLSVRQNIPIKHAIVHHNLELLRALQANASDLEAPVFTRELGLALQAGDKEIEFLQFMFKHEDNHRLIDRRQHIPIDGNADEPKTLALLWQHLPAKAVYLENNIKRALRSKINEELLLAYIVHGTGTYHITGAAEFCRSVYVAEKLFEKLEHALVGKQHENLYSFMYTFMTVYRNAVDDSNLALMSYVMETCQRLNVLDAFIVECNIHRMFMAEMLEQPLTAEHKQVLIQIMQDLKLKESRFPRYNYLLYIINDPDLLAHPVPSPTDAVEAKRSGGIDAVNPGRLIFALQAYGADNVSDEKLSELVHDPSVQRYLPIIIAEPSMQDLPPPSTWSASSRAIFERQTRVRRRINRLWKR